MLDYLEGYRVFYRTALAGSFTKAAEQLFISQPAVTQAIKQLERQLGGQLFFRTSKGVRLTAEGEVLFRYLEQAFHLVEEGERRLADMHQLVSGEIKLGAGDTLCKHFLLPYLQEFHAAYPEIKIQVANRTTPETVALLKAGRIDLGIVSLPLSDSQLEIRKCMEIRDGMVAGASYRRLQEDALTLAELTDYPILTLERGSHSRSSLDAYAAGQGVPLQPEIELGSLDLLVEFARAGFGIAHVILDFVRRELESGELFEIPLRVPIPRRQVGVAYLRDVPLPSATKEFLRRLPDRTGA
ncbi:LysR family transcriptional regulator [Gorillibacterium sp. sgz5001074]|uniref:LysR family transcriptional regulator n=1 Tax=Gorillibacterium sp. sgz5001074 TaxID=3446695 RepID=UPI003F663CB6